MKLKIWVRTYIRLLPLHKTDETLYLYFQHARVAHVSMTIELGRHHGHCTYAGAGPLTNLYSLQTLLRCIVFDYFIYTYIYIFIMCFEN